MAKITKLPAPPPPPPEPDYRVELSREELAGILNALATYNGRGWGSLTTQATEATLEEGYNQ
jgi:hypothetical protein